MPRVSVSPVISFDQFREFGRVDVPPTVFTRSAAEERIEGAYRMKSFAMAQLIFGGLSIFTGIVTIYMASPNPQFPFILGTDIWNGVVCFASGSLAYRVSYLTKRQFSPQDSLMFSYIFYGILSFVCLVISCLGLGLNIYAICLCVDAQLPNSHACLPRKEPNLAMAVTDFFLEGIVLGLSICTAWQFSKYRSAFGILLPCDRYIESGWRTRQKAGGPTDGRRQLSEEILRANGFVLSDTSSRGGRSFESFGSGKKLTGMDYYESKKAMYTFS